MPNDKAGTSKSFHIPAKPLNGDSKSVVNDVSLTHFIGSLLTLDCGPSGVYQGKILAVDTENITITLHLPFRDGKPLDKPVEIITKEMLRDVPDGGIRVIKAPQLRPLPFFNHHGTHNSTSRGTNQQKSVVSPRSPNNQNGKMTHSKYVKPRNLPSSSLPNTPKTIASSNSNRFCQKSTSTIQDSKSSQQKKVNGAISPLQITILKNKDVNSNDILITGNDFCTRNDIEQNKLIPTKASSGTRIQISDLLTPNKKSPSNGIVENSTPHSCIYKDYGDFRKFRDQQTAAPLRLESNKRNNGIGPSGIPTIDCSNGYERFAAQQNKDLSNPIDYHLFNTDFDFAGNLALFNKNAFDRQFEEQQLSNGFNITSNRNYRNNENILTDGDRITSWTQGQNHPKINHN